MLDSLKTTSAALRGCFAAVRSAAPEGRRVTRALANLSRCCAVTGTVWSTRHVTPLHKSGPRVVRSTSCLRPILLSAVMTSVIDGQWNLRNSCCWRSHAGWRNRAALETRSLSPLPFSFTLSFAAPKAFPHIGQ